MTSVMITQPWEAPPRRRLHVLHVSEPTSQGVAVVATSYVREQLARGWNVTVACPSDGWFGYAARELGARARWWSASPAGRVRLLGERSALARIVAECHPDVIHLHGSRAGLVGRAVVRGSVPTVYQPHGWSFLGATGRAARSAMRWERFAARWTDELICVSEGERAIGEDAGVRSPTTVLPNGVDLDDHPAPEHDARAIARGVLRLADRPTAVCVGRLSRQKGQQDLLAAWSAVRAEVPGAQLVLVGDGPDRAALERAAADLDGVRFVGARNDVALWLQAAHVVVVPSRWEAMALVPLEAMAAARSVVATDVAGIAESVPEDAGEIVSPGDLEALATAVAHRLRYWGEADDEGLVGRAYVELAHDAAGSARELSATYLRLLASRRQSRR